MNHTSNRLVRLIVGCATTGGLLAVPALAHAADLPAPARIAATPGPVGTAPVPVPVPVPGFYRPVRVTATSPAGDATEKTVTVACPAGTLVAGAGVEISDTLAYVWPTEVRPHRDLAEVTVSALADRPTGWSVTAVAVCARPRATHERVTNTVASMAGNSKTAYASCPAGTLAIGTGFEITGDVARSGATVSRVLPSADLSGVSVTATGFVPPWGLQAYAICSSVQSATRTVDSPFAMARLVDDEDGCPPGTSLTGVGAELFDEYGNPTTGGFILELAPDGSLDEPDASADWWYTAGTTDAYGICVSDSST